MNRSLFLILSLIMGLSPALCPVMYALEPKADGASISTSPAYAVTFYEKAKSCYEQLTKDGYRSWQMTIVGDTVKAERHDAWSNTIHRATVDMGVKSILDTHSIDAATLYYKASVYAKEMGDKETASWLSAILRTEMIRSHGSGLFTAINAVTGVAIICVGTICLSIASLLSHKGKIFWVTQKEQLDPKIMRNHNDVQDQERLVGFNTRRGKALKQAIDAGRLRNNSSDEEMPDE